MKAIEVRVGGKPSEPLPIALNAKGQVAPRRNTLFAVRTILQIRSAISRQLSTFIQSFRRTERKGAMNSDSKLAIAVENALAPEFRRIERIGTLGQHCYFCGRDWTEVSRKACTCGFAQEFGCAHGPSCAGCSDSMAAVAKFLRRMFASAIVTRANSQRFALDQVLYAAAMATCRTQDNRNSLDVRDLVLWLGFADAIDDEPASFESKTLRAFSKTRFTDFQRLRIELGKEENARLARSLIRRALPKPQPRVSEMSAESRAFYE